MSAREVEERDPAPVQTGPANFASMTAPPQGIVPCIEFPRTMLPLLRCVRDAGELTLVLENRSGPIGVIDGMLRCRECSAEYAIESGIARMMTHTVTAENAHEMSLKDIEYRAMPEEFVAPESSWRSELNDLIEVGPHLDALKPLEGKRVLELACGDGRFTLLMAQLGAQVLAVDFAIDGLRQLAKNLARGTPPTLFKVKPVATPGEMRERVALVHADASRFAAAPRSFDRALSATPCDGRDERMAMYRCIADSLADEGFFIGGVEHDYLLRRWLGMPIGRRYSPGGIFIEHLNSATMKREAAPYFARIRTWPIRAHVPFVNRLKLSTSSSARLALAVSAIPGLRQLGTIILMRAERPFRANVDGQKRPGSSAVKRFYRWYKRRHGEEPNWDLVDRV